MSDPIEIKLDNKEVEAKLLDFAKRSEMYLFEWGE